MVGITTGESDMSGQATIEAGVQNADLAQHTLPAGPGQDATVGAARVVPFPTERPVAADPEAGVLVADRYRLVELVGRGATAQVWRARDELLDRDVAVKQVDRSHPYALVEARLAARVRHPHVGVVHDVVVHAGSDWLVMDYHPGASLAAVLSESRRLSPAAVAALGLQLLAALRAVHEAGVVHCDVKPANLLLDEDGHVVLVDFGIAETAGGDPAHPARRTGHVVGSPAFMAPELVRGEAPQPAADLWSLGTTLYMAVEGRPPFPQAEAVPTLTAVLQDVPQPARHAGRLQPLLALLLDKDPARRPSHDVVHAMLTEAYPSNRPIPAPPRPAAALRERGQHVPSPLRRLSAA
jgi:serine/threonine protein kinase